MRNIIKKILIVDSYAGNIGDIGILVSLIDQLQKKYQKLKITVESSHPKLLKKIIKVKGITLVNRVFDIEKIDNESSNIFKKIFYSALGIYDLASVFIKILFTRINLHIPFIIRKSKKLYVRNIIDTDLIISTGGGFLNTNFIYIFRLYIYSLGLILNKKISLVAQSIGPFNSQFSKIIFPFFLNKIPLVSVREPYSYDYLKKFNLNKIPNKTADLAYLLATDSNINIPLKNKFNKFIVAISLKEDKNELKQSNFIIIMSEISNKLINENFYILLVCHTYKDRILANQIFKNITHKENLEIISFGINPKLLKYIYGKCRFVIASRMHSVVFCSDLKIPFISISSDNKFFGLHTQLQYNKKLLLDYSNLKYNELNEAISFLKINHLTLKNKLAKIIPIIRRESIANMHLINNQLI